jgi:hypothetical protein
MALRWAPPEILYHKHFTCLTPAQTLQLNDDQLILTETELQTRLSKNPTQQLWP